MYGNKGSTLKKASEFSRHTSRRWCEVGVLLLGLGGVGRGDGGEHVCVYLIGFGPLQAYQEV